MPIINRITGEIVLAQKIPFTPGWRVSDVVETWNFDIRAIPLSRTISHGGSFAFDFQQGSGLKLTMFYFDYPNRKVLRIASERVKEIILPDTGISNISDIITTNADIYCGDCQFPPPTVIGTKYTSPIGPTINGGYWFVDVFDGKYSSPYTGRSYSSGIVFLSTDLDSFVYKTTGDFIGLNQAIKNTIETNVYTLFNRYTGGASSRAASPFDLTLISIEEMRLTRLLVYPSGIYNKFVCFCTVIFRAMNNSLNTEIESLIHIQFIARIENESIYLDSSINIENYLENTATTELQERTDYIVFAEGKTCRPSNSIGLYIDNVFIGNVVVSSYDSVGNFYSVAMIRREYDPQYYPLAYVWHRGRLLANSPNGYLVNSSNVMDKFIRQIIDPVSMSASYDLVDIEDVIVDTDGRCAAMPYDIPALRFSDTFDGKVIDRNDNVIFSIPDTEPSYRFITTWNNNSDNFILIGNDVYHQVRITQDSGISWDLCFPNEFQRVTIE